MLLIVVACDNPALRKKEPLNDTALKDFVASHLQVGDDRKKIESFLQSKDWSFGFNQFKSRYECHYKPGDVDKWYAKTGVGIHIYLDKDERLIRLEIVRSATGL